MQRLLIALVLLAGCAPVPPEPQTEIHIRIPTPIGEVEIDRSQK